MKRRIRNVGASGPELGTSKRQDNRTWHDNHPKRRRIEKRITRDSEPEMGTAKQEDNRGWHNTQPSINDLPLELLLLIFSWLSVRDLCLSVAPVCTRWRLLAKHPSLWTELSFIGDYVCTKQACGLLHMSPMLKKLALTDRNDSNAILRKVCTSNLRIHTIEMKGCRGTRKEFKIKADVFTKILKLCSKLSILTSDDTHISSCDFYRLLGDNHSRFDHVNLLNATKKEITCFLEASLNPRTQRNTEGIVDRHPEEVTLIF
jgi:hypothetical protein